MKVKNKGRNSDKTYLIIQTQNSDVGVEDRYVVIVDGMEPSIIDRDDIPDGSKVYLLSCNDVAVSIPNREMGKKKNKVSVAIGITNYSSVTKRGRDRLNRVYASYNQDVTENTKKLKIVPFASIFDNVAGGVKKRDSVLRIGFYLGGDVNRVYITVFDKLSNQMNITDRYVDSVDSAKEVVSSFELSDPVYYGMDIHDIIITQDCFFDSKIKDESAYPLKNEWMGVPFVYLGVASIVFSLAFFGIVSAYKTIKIDELENIKNEINEIKNVKMQEIEGKKRDIYKTHIVDYIKSMNIDYHEVLDVSEHVWTTGTIVSVNADENTKRVVVTLPKDVSESDFERRKKIEEMIKKEPVNGYSKQPLSSDSTISDVEAVYVKETIQ